MALTETQKEAILDSAETYAERHIMALDNVDSHARCGLNVKASDAMRRAEKYKAYAAALNELLKEV